MRAPQGRFLQGHGEAGSSVAEKAQPRLQGPKGNKDASLPGAPFQPGVLPAGRAN